MEPFESRVRARVTAYTSALIIGLAALIFGTTIQFLPAPPIFPLLVGLGLAALSLKDRGAATAGLYILVYFSVMWQLIGFGFFQLIGQGVGVTVIVSMALPLLPFFSARVELGSMAMAVLAVALMMTPAYFVSVPLIAAAAAFSGFASIATLAGTFLLFLTPLLILDNAIYYTSTAAASAPVIFGQLAALDQSIRPPLAALNIFLTGIPGSYLASDSRPVAEFMQTQSGILVIPMVLLAIVLFVSSSAGGVTRSLLDRFMRAHEYGGNARIIVPVAVAVVTPAVFIVLLTALSGPSAGGFQTSLTSDPTHLQAVYMVGASILISGSFIGRESLILRMERLQLGTDSLRRKMDECMVKMKQVQALIETISTRVPSVSLTAERRSMQEYSSYLADIDRQIRGADVAAVGEFLAKLEANILRPLNEYPERLRGRVAGELRTLIAATGTCNQHLKEAGVPAKYPEIERFSDSTPLPELFAIYEVATASIRDAALKLTDLYDRALEALNTLMGQEEVTPPVSPNTLLDSHEYVSTMRLVAEEYWLNFHLRWMDPLHDRTESLLDRTGRLRDILSDEERKALAAIEEVFESGRPADSVLLLEKAGALKAFLDGVIVKLSSGADRLEKMLESLDLKSVRTIRFETITRVKEVLDLREMLASTDLALDNLTSFIEGALPVLRTQTLAWKNDHDNLVVLADYPLAKKIIADKIATRRYLPLSELPYNPRSAALYAQIYVAGNPDVEYEASNGRLVNKQHA